MAKKPTPKKILTDTPTSCPKKPCYLSLLVAGAVGFALAFVLLKGCPTMSTCPMYSEVCPVTSTLEVLEADLQRGDLPKAKQSAAKLSESLERTMPDLAKIADDIANSRNLAGASAKVEVLKKKMMSDVSALPTK
jgi:hypothetical protein